MAALPGIVETAMGGILVGSKSFKRGDNSSNGNCAQRAVSFWRGFDYNLPNLDRMCRPFSTARNKCPMGW